MKDSAEWIRHYLSGDDNDKRPYAIVVVMPFTGAGEKTADQVWRAVKLARKDHCAIAAETKASCDQNLLALHTADDGGDTVRAKELGQAIVGESRNVAVIGHLTSSVTESALHTYCPGGNSIPLLMPIATATHIVDVAKDLGCSAILRLPPTNLEQGERTAGLLQYLLETGALNPQSALGTRTIAVFRDLSNPTYSNDLAHDFEYSLRHSYFKAGWQIVLDQGIAGDSGGVIVSSDVRTNYLANVLLIAGMTDAVLETLRQAKLANWKPSLTILTDGAFSADLLANGRDVLTDSTYLEFPVDTSMPKLQALNQQLGLSLNEISYAAYGYDAAKLLFTAIDRVASARHGKLSRKALRELIANWRSSSVGAGQNEFVLFDHYSFDQSGNALDPNVTLYKYNSAASQFLPIRDNGMIRQ